MGELRDDMLMYRAKENITQAELAERCKLTTQTICNIETGQQTPAQITIAKIRYVIGKEDE